MPIEFGFGHQVIAVSLWALTSMLAVLRDGNPLDMVLVEYMTKYGTATGNNMILGRVHHDLEALATFTLEQEHVRCSACFKVG
jgi:hypothetical protein